MKVLLVATMNPQGTTLGRHCLKAFYELGHEVRVVDLNRRWSVRTAFLGILQAKGFLPGRNSLLPFRDLERKGREILLNRELLQAVQAFHPDLLFVIKGVNIQPEVISEAKRHGVVTACWWVDDPMDFKRSLRRAPLYDFYFTNCRRSVKAYRQYGVNAFYLAGACDPGLHKQAALASGERARLGSDLCFIGTHHPVREQVLSRLAGFDLKIWGPGWTKHLDRASPLRRAVQGEGIFWEEMVKAYNAARLGLNLHSWFGLRDFGLNQRIFEIAGCGTAQLTDWKEEVSLHFQESEVAWYRTVDELMEKVRYYLDHPKEREELGRRGQWRAYRDHTFANRVAELLSALKLG